MKLVKSLTVALGLVMGLASVASAAPRHVHHGANGYVSYSDSGAYAEGGAAGFQDHFNNE